MREEKQATLWVVGLGLGDVLEPKAQEIIERVDAIYVQTDRFLACKSAAGERGEYLDAIYENAEDFDALNREISACIMQRLHNGMDVALCVLGEGTGENSAARLAAATARDEGYAVQIHPGTSLWAAVRAACGLRADSFTLLSVQDLTPRNALAACGGDLAITPITGRMAASEIKLTLAEAYPEEHTVFLYDPVMGGEPAQFPLYELDRQKEYTSFAFLAVPPAPLLQRQRFNTEDLVEICRILRSPSGCPWDAEQTHQSLRANLLEETYEVLAAIAEEDDLHLAEELGDVLLQIALHSVIGEEHTAFTIEDVSSGICQKMIRRHPHVFADGAAKTTQEVLDTWEEIKKQERGQSAQDVPSQGAKQVEKAGRGMPPLAMAEKTQAAARKMGFDWDKPEQALEKVEEELGELRAAADENARLEEGGDLLFACVNALRLFKIDPSVALCAATEKFKSRFLAMDSLARSNGKKLEELPLEEQDYLYNLAKKQEK